MKGIIARPGEAILLGEKIRVTVLEIRGDQALIGIQGLTGGLPAHEPDSPAEEPGTTDSPPTGPLLAGKF